MASIFKRHFRQWPHAAALLTLGIAVLPASAQSLVQMVEMAQRFDAPWQAQRAALDAAQFQAAQARAGLLPSVGAQMGATYSRTDVHPHIAGMRRSAQQQNAAVQATQPLYRPANRITALQGERHVELVQAQLDATTQDLLVRVSQAYFDVLAAQDTLRTVQAQKRAVQEQLAFAKRNFEIGAATITDTHEAQSRHDLVVAQEIASANDLRVKQLALEQTVCHSPLQPWPLRQPVQLPPVLPADAAPWVERAQHQQPMVRQAQLALELAELETRKAEAGHRPTVDLQASYGIQRNPDGTSTIPVGNRLHQAQVGVVMNVPLFAGFAIENRVRETLALQDKARADVDHAQRSSAQAARQAFYGVQSGTAQVQALQAAVTSSQSALQANQVGYQVGVRINMDVLNAQSQLFQTQRDLAQARYNVLLGQLKLRQATGDLQLRDVQALEPLLQVPEPAQPPASSGARAAH